MREARGSPPAPDPGRFDERDTMFARAALEPGTPAYDAYYARRPHLREIDDRLRALPPLCAPGGRFFDPRVMAEAQAHFDAIEAFVPDAELAARLARRLGGEGALRRVLRRDPAAAGGTRRPAGALSAGPRELVRGAWKWPTGVERCYRYWRTVGTDCGVCMAVCPFSHADSAFHNVVRWVVRRAPWAHRALLAADDAVYGRRWRGAFERGRS